MKAHPDRRGLSLLELLLVLAMIGLFLGLGFPLLNQYLTQKRLDEAAVALSSALRRASDEAVTRSESVTLTLSPDKLSWVGEDARNLGAASLPKGATVAPTSATVRFSGRGLPTRKHDFTVTLASRQKAVYLLPTGAVVIR